MSKRRVNAPLPSDRLRRREKLAKKARARRKMQLEMLEQRQLLAVGPRLISIEPNSENQLSPDEVLNKAPTELKFAFDAGDVIDQATLDNGILLFRSDGDDLFGNGNDIEIEPAYVGIGDSANEVVMRFASTLPDDRYQIQIIGTGPDALRDVDGFAFGDTTDDDVDNGSSFSLAFELRLGAQVISVVPQPIVRDPSTGALTQLTNQIDVYFNDDELNLDVAQTPAFYRLIDTRDESLMFPQSVSYDPAEGKATLTFASDLSTSTYQLQIGETEEANETIDGATDLGTIVQQATAVTYDSPVTLDANGTPVPLDIPDNGSVLSAISVTDSFFISDVDVEVDIDHEWGPDLRVFLVGPQGQRVELIQDLGSQARGGQIYGVQYDDANANGFQDEDEAGLPGWTIFIDNNDNGRLDPGERSTVTDSEGRYSFVGLELNRFYEVVAIPEVFWQPTNPGGGAGFEVFSTDFSNGNVQSLVINGNTTAGSFRVGFDGRLTVPIVFDNADASVTADNLLNALLGIVDPGVDVSVTTVNTKEFTMRFDAAGVGTPIDHPAIEVIDNQLNTGTISITNVGDASGFTSDGPNNLWHLSSGRGNAPGHTPQFSFYFGQGEAANGGGSYVDNADGTLRSPEIDLSDPTLTGTATLRLNHFLQTEQNFDFADISVVAGGQTTSIFNTDNSTSGFEQLSLNLTPFLGQKIQLEFTFQSDTSVTQEGWYVDDIRVEIQRPSQSVPLFNFPELRIAKGIDFGSNEIPNVGPDAYGYRAFQVGTEFDDISGNPTAQKLLENFNVPGLAAQIGGSGSDAINGMTVDAAGNVYVAGSFQGTVDFDLGAGVNELTSAGGNDAFVAKYDSSGALLWVRSGGGTSSDVATSVAVNGNGDVVVSGSFAASANFDGNALTSNGSTDALIWKLDSSGATLWAVGLGGSAIDEARDVEIDAAGEVVATGFFSGTVDFDPGAGTQNEISAGSTDAFVLRLDSAGGLDWVQAIGGTGADRGEGITITSSGYVTTTGSFTGTVDFNDSAGVSNLNSAGSTDGFVQQVASNGQFRWARRFGGTGSDRGTDVASLGNGVYVTGVNNSNVYVQRFGTTGNNVWTRNYGGGSTDVGESISVASDGSVMVGGSFRGTVNFGGTVLNSAGGSDAFALLLNSVGAVQRVSGYGGTLDDVATGAIFESEDSFLVAGNFRGIADFDIGTSVEQLTSNGGSDGFVARVGTPTGSDDVSVALDATGLNGFEFDFYGTTYGDQPGEIWVGSNGLITFVDGYALGDNTDLLLTPDDPTIAVFWESLLTGGADTDGVFWEVVGENDSQQLIVQWKNVRLSQDVTGSLPALNFQVVLSESDDSIQLNYQTVASSPAIVQGNPSPVGTFRKGVQQDPNIARDANGNYVIAWRSTDQDGDGFGVYARRYNSSGVALGGEFRVNETTVGDQFRPRVAMTDDGRFVVSWSGNGNGDDQGVFARLYNANGTPATGEFLVHQDNVGDQIAESVEMDASGNFVVGWSGQGDDDVEGAYIRRFAADGTPLGTVDEVQRIKFEGPPNAGSIFTLVHAGAATGTIAWSNNANTLAAEIQSALRALGNTGNQIDVVALPDSNEVQRLSFVGGAASGNFMLRLGNDVTPAITFSGPGGGATTAADIQAALEGLAGVGAGNVTVTQDGGSDQNFIVTFIGALAATDVETLQFEANNLNAGSLDITVSNDGTNSGQDFEVRFLGPDGGQDQPELSLGNTQNGVTHMQVTTVDEGHNGQIRVNNTLINRQKAPKLDVAPTGEFVVAFDSFDQDGDGWGIFAKRYDANGVPIAPEFDEVQRLILNGPSNNALFSLQVGGSTTGLIQYAGPNGGSNTAVNIQAAINALPELSGVVVTPEPGASNEVQTIFFTQGPGNTPGAGTFRLAHRGEITAPITFAGGAAANAAATATNIEDALRALPNTGDQLTVVAAQAGGNDDPFEFIVTFLGPDGAINHPELVPVNINLNQGSLFVVTDEEGGMSNNEFRVEYLGDAGRRDQPNIQLVVNNLGLSSITVDELVRGASSEFQVNVEANDNQEFSSVVIRPDGSFFIAWVSDEQDGDDAGIFGKLYDPLGNVLRDEFQINTFTQGSQRQPRVGSDASGNLVVAWVSDEQDGDGAGVFARRIPADGFPIADEFQINTLTTGFQGNANLVVEDDGSFVVVFASQAGEGGIHSQRVDANDNFVGPETQVSQFGSKDQSEPAIARNTGGDYVVVWTDDVRDDESGPSIYAQVFNAAGVALSPEFRVNETTPLVQNEPSVAIDDSGNVTIVWAHEFEEVVGPTTTTQFDILARRFDSTGAPLTGEFQVNDVFTDFFQQEPDVAVDPDSGEFIITWAGNEANDTDVYIRARLYDAAGVAVGSEFNVSTARTGNSFQPSAAMNANGDFVIGWDDFDLDLVVTRSYLRLFDSAGTAISDDVEVYAASDSDFQFGTDVGIDAAGNVVATWANTDFNTFQSSVWTRQFDASGAPLGNAVVVSETISNAFGDELEPEVSVAPGGSFNIVWAQNDEGLGIQAQRYNGSGDPLGGNFRIDPFVGSVGTSPGIVLDDAGGFIVSWLDDGTDVYTLGFVTDHSTTGIKDAGPQQIGENVLQVSVDGITNGLVGPNTSTRIAVIDEPAPRMFAIDGDDQLIVELDSETGAVLNSFPSPVASGADAGLAFAGNTLYFVAADGSELYILDPNNGAVIDTMTLAGVSSSGLSGLAVLNGQVVLLDSTAGELIFIDPFNQSEIRRLMPAVPIKGGLAGGGDRGTLFGINNASEIIEIDGVDGSLINTLPAPGIALVGLAVVQNAVLATNASGTTYRLNKDTGAVEDVLAVPGGLSALGADGEGGVARALGGDYQPLLQTILDDEALVSITEGIGPYSGRYRPVEPLSSFDGTNALGPWRLEVQDVEAGNTGVLNGWRLLFNDQNATSADTTFVGYIGDNLDPSVNAEDDVDLYRFELLEAGTISIDAIPQDGLDVAIRLFNAAGGLLAEINSAGADAVEQLVHNVISAGTYYVGLSSFANMLYSPIDGSGAAGGSSTGSYRLDLRFSEPLAYDDDNSSFETATVIGPLGVGGASIRTEIRNEPFDGRMPGAIDEPGHREIPHESHLLADGAHGHDHGQIIIGFADNVSAARRAEILQQVGVEPVKRFDFINADVAAPKSGGDIAAKLLELEGMAEVRYAHLDQISEFQLLPNDTDFPSMWHLNNTGQTGGTVDADIDMPEAWDVTTGSAQTVIAILDSGVAYDHPDLAPNMWINPGEVPGNGIDDDGNGYIDDIYGIDSAEGDSDPYDTDGHGTHVAGTTAAAGDNGFGVTGVNWNSKIMAMKVGLDSGGIPDSAVIEALNYLVTMKTVYGINIVVSNNSYGGAGFAQATRDAIEASNNAGIPFVAAAGNFSLDNDATPFYPASYDLPGIISVAATDHNDQLAGFSHVGATSVDIAAPGVNIMSTTLGGGYGLNSGTSMASPHVAGVVALLAGYNPAATVGDLKSAVMIGGDLLPGLAGTSVSGARLNAAQALSVLGVGGGLTFGNATTTAMYNFQDIIGVLPSGAQAVNAITEIQKERAREIFEIYSEVAGIQFIETANEGMTIATGDMRALDPTVIGGPGGVAGLAGGGLTGTAIMDAGENWGSSEYGGGWFQVAMHEIGHLLGLGHAYDLPNLTIMGGFGVGEPVFPGDHDIVHVQFVLPPATIDQDIYQFSLNEPGVFTAETIAERIAPNSSLLDTVMSLYQELPDGTRRLISRNDDYYSNDSYINVHLDAGDYYISVTAANNEDLDPTISDTGFGGTSDGEYELRLDFQPDPASSIVDLEDTAFDGDADGTPGGVFDFYFETGHTIFVDKMADVSSGSDGDGEIDSPFDNILTATERARSTLVMPIGGGEDLNDGDSFTISDGLHADVRFEFDSNGVVSPGSYAVPFSPDDTRDELAAAVALAIEDASNDSPSVLGVSVTVSGPNVMVDGTANVDLSGTQALLDTPVIVRIVGNGGEDGDVSTVADNRPYLLGIDDDVALDDGATVEVPQGVTVMIDAGALFKMQQANIDVGSSAEGVDRRYGALQVLGTPDEHVIFGSYRNDNLGGDSNGPGPIPAPGDWGGLVFRADSDMEDQGIFLSSVNNATLNNGGGKLEVGSVEEIFTPIHLVGARPAIWNNTITRSADAAISADPASFEDTQDRIGPDIHSNTIEINSLNGLFVRIRTELGEVVDRVTLPSRFDDTDVVHILTENLLIEATPGGPLKDPITGVVAARLDGSLTIDPGIIVKLEGSRIETLLGGQLIAEGNGQSDVTFTALNDDSFGGSGSFDTKNDGSNTFAAPGQWGGLFFAAMSKGSIDHALVAYAGGLTPIEGGFDRFNAIEIHQGDVRIANSFLRDNAPGTASTNRSGRGSNASATIFVRGAQPVLVENVIKDNSGTVININANSMQEARNPDHGRQTGMIDRYSQFDDNHGPLVALNELFNNGLNAMEVRPGVLTTEAVWDDSGIAHVLRGEIVVLNHHTYSGLHLISRNGETLVVKLEGADAGFTADGTLLDIDDRIGGSLYIGGGDSQVIMTSLADDTVSAGVDFFGNPLGDTNNDGDSTGSPGDWRSVRLDRYSNDRNVTLIREEEAAFRGADDINAVPVDAQFLGNLAPDEKSGDVNRRLGFEVRGTISLTDSRDLDVYSFEGVAGTEVYFDLDHTNSALDTIVELVDATGTVLSRSIDDQVDNLSGDALPLLKAAHLGTDYFTISSRDAGMRTILPGVAGETNTYYVRVRSASTPDAVETLDAGLSRGEYRLQIRLQQRDEIPGSFIDGAEIRFATNGIEVLGMPGHSPLIGESVETRAGNATLGASQPLGNLLESDRNTISVAGNLTAPNDVDWYSFEVDYEFIQAIAGRNGGGKTWATVFDIDYADGLARADTVISVFDENGNLVLVSRDSNIEDDQPGAGQGADTDDLTRGTFGTLDPFIGSVQLPEGTARTYYVAITSNLQLPQALNGTFTSGAGNQLVRLEPVTSVQRIAEDHIGFQGYVSGNFDLGVPVDPTTPLFDISSSISLSANVVPYALKDVTLYTGRPGTDGLQTVNPYTGELYTDVGDLPTNNPNRVVTDVVMRSDGRLYIYESLFGQPGQNTAGRLVEIDPETGAQTVIGNDSIPDIGNANPPNIQELTSSAVQGFAWEHTGSNNLAQRYNLWYAVEGGRRGPGVDPNSSTLYRANPANGSAAVQQGQPWGLRGEIFESTPGDIGVTTGMAFAGGVLYGVSDTGKFYQISTATGRASNVVDISYIYPELLPVVDPLNPPLPVTPSFTGLTEGPENLEGGRLANVMFASTADGRVIALDTNGVLQTEFLAPDSSGILAPADAMQIGSGSSVGIAFSPFDFNLWHPTERRGNDAGHGINTPFDVSRDPTAYDRLVGDATDTRDHSESQGGASFYFGLETWVNNPSNSEVYLTYDGINAQYGLGSERAHRDLSNNPLIGENYNLPGGASGTLQTNAIDLSDYDFADNPTIYFNYFLETEGRNTITTSEMRDSARVLVSSDGGTTWDLLATNNSVLSTAALFGELPRFISPSVTAGTHPRQQVQELFDNTGSWRQARIDLSNYAGQADLTFRFEFATAGAFVSDQGFGQDFDDRNSFGNIYDQDKAQNNSFEGFYVDDIIIGFSERGEMVTNSPSQSDFFQIPQNPNPADPIEILVGDYQLEIRRGTEYGESINDLNPDIYIFQTLDTNDRLIRDLYRLGDRNLHRDQGQILIANNTVTQSSGYGVLVDAGNRDAGDSWAHPGGVRALPTLNNERLVAGVKVENNVISNFGNGGILFSGDPNTGTTPLASVPFGRIMNNTVYGGETATGVGIQVTENASPTILNNIVANTVDGLTIDGTSSTTVVGANLFSGNGNDGVIGENAIVLQPGDPLFVDPNNQNFYLASGSLAIDSSLNSLADRPNFVAVNLPLGIPPSPILAPERDRFQQLRLDDPSQDPPPGLGSNIFKDRGAVERADFIGPFVTLLTPEDNDAFGIDLDDTLTVVQLDSGDLSALELIFSDEPGIGLDVTTVTPDRIQLSQNGIDLVPGVDYNAQFFPNSNTFSMSPLAGDWPSDAVFVITVDNQNITDLAGNTLQPNQSDGATRFTILMPDVQLDFGDAPDSYQTLGTSGGPRHAVTDTLVPRLGANVDAEVNGQPVDNDDALGVDDEDGVPVGAFNGSTQFGGLFLSDTTIVETSDPAEVVGFLNRSDAAGTVIPFDVVGDGVLDAWIDFNRDGDFNESNERVLSGVSVVDGINHLRVITPANASLGTTWARFRISATGSATPGGIANSGEVEDYPVSIRDVSPADANDDDFYVATEDQDLVVDGINFPALTDNDVIPSEEFIEPRVYVDGAIIPDPNFLIFRTANGQVRIDDPIRGLFTYTPDQDFEGTDTFRYAVSTQRNEGPEFIASADFATVTIQVNGFNAPPEFEIPDEVAVLEDDPTTWVINDFFSDIRGGAPEFGDDEAGQTVTFEIVQLSANPSDLMGTPPRLPDVSNPTAIEFFPEVDLAGQAIYVVTGTDDGVPAESTSKTFTVNVRPVNDPPRFDPDVAGTGQVNGPDEAWEVAEVIDPQSGLVTDATITYTLREDLAQPAGTAVQPFFIPYYQDTNQSGYSPIGLMDVFTVGPDNEADPMIEGGGQTLQLPPGVPSTTALGGTLIPGVDGVFYIPPQDFNRDIGGVDSFVYSVMDDGTSYIGGVLVPDPKSSTNIVEFNLVPVNDKPIFGINLPPSDPNDPGSPLLPVEIPEDSAPTRIDSFGFGAEAGPPTSAFDEVNVISGQSVNFEVRPLSFDAGDAADFFTQFPTISPLGTLEFQAAPNVFGTFDFEVVLVDDGADDEDVPVDQRRGDRSKSDPQTFTIEVLPINDPPILDPNVDPLEYTIDEDTTIDILNRGTPGDPGLLDVFLVGPGNEGDDIEPGGNQTLSIKLPTPTSSSQGGTVSQILDAQNQVIGLRYQPRQDFVGIDQFIYTVTDDGITVRFGTGGVEESDPRIASNTVTIEVLPENDPPQYSGPSSVTVDEDAGAVSIANWASNVLPGPPTATDELDNQDLFFTITQVGGDTGLFVSAPTAVIDPDNNTASLVFETIPDANGVATFTAQLTDVPTDGTTAVTLPPRTFTLRVNAVNDPPTFDRAPNPIEVDEDSGLYFAPWATNISPGPADESTQTVSFNVDIPAGAEDLFQQLPEIAPDGTLRFIPALDAHGTVDLMVTAVDTGGDPGSTSDAVLLRIQINPINDPPVGVRDEFDTDEDTAIAFTDEDLLANDLDPDLPNDSLSIILGETTFSINGARVTYDPVSGQIVYDPTASDTLQALPPYQPEIVVGGIVVQEEQGRLVDTFTYKVQDSANPAEVSREVTVAVTVDGINDAPVAVPDNPTLNPDGPTIIPVLSNDSDIDGDIDPTSIEITLYPAFGEIAIDSQGVITFTASQSFALEDVFRYRVADNEGEYSNEALVTIEANARPIARSDRAVTYLDEAITINVVSNDEDPDRESGAPNNGLDLSSIQIVGDSFPGEAVPLGDGTIRYIPSDGFLGVASFQYTIEDLAGRVSHPGTVQVQVVGSRLQNPNLNADVNDDGFITPLDALLVVNRLALSPTGSVPVDDDDVGPPYYDVNGDQLITPQDALEVIYVLGQQQSGLGESVEAEQVFEDDVFLGPLELDFVDTIDDDDDDDEERLLALDAAFADVL